MIKMQANLSFIMRACAVISYERVKKIPLSLMALLKGAAVKLGYPLGLKKEQLDVVVAFMSGKDVFAVLTTGYGKSLCYACCF